MTVILFDPDHLEDPYPRYRHWREHHPIWFDAGNDSWVLSRHDDVLRVFKDHEAFSSSGLAEGPAAAVRLPLLNDDPPRHTQLRALVSRAFTSRALRHMEGRVESLANDLAAALPTGQPVDVAERLTIPLPILIIADTMAIPIDRADDFKRWSDALTATREFSPEERMEQVAEMGAFFMQLLPERRAAPGEDLISRLVTAQVDGESLSDEEIAGFCMLLLIAGNETTTNLMSNFLYHCAQHPAVWDTLRRDPCLVEAAMEETLRYDAPVQYVERKALRDVEFHGETIAAGERVTILMGSANRDPEAHRAPDEFLLDRDRISHTTFGHGIHFCLGAPLGRLESHYLTRALLGRFSGLRLAQRPGERTASHMLRGFHHLWLEFEPA
jgi:cytochrome P450